MLTLRCAVHATLALGALALPGGSARAYPVDCAILLCLAGGWPANPVCTYAKATVVRRITPFPVEPPLQVWRCPMGGMGPAAAARVGGSALAGTGPAGSSPPMAAGTDPSDPALDVVRSIRVHHVQYAQRTTSGGGAGEECQRRDGSRLGTYDADGGFRWEATAAAAVPSGPGLSAFDPPRNCRPYRYRSVTVSWTDALGHAGFEEVRY